MSKTILMTSVLVFSLFPGTAAAGGACCAGAKGAPGSASITFAAAYASSHEMLNGAHYTLRQSAVLASAARPLTRALNLQFLAGLPLRTSLSRTGREMEGAGGIIYGIGLGYTLRVAAGLDLHASAGYSGSSSRLDTDSGTATDMKLRISELYASLTAERKLGKSAAVYGGMRAYSGKAELHGGAAAMHRSGHREGSLAVLAGLRRGLSERVGVVVDAAAGHTKVLSAGITYNF